MKPVEPQPPLDANEEISALIETLHATGRRLEELTAGEVDGVSDRDGRTFLLRHVQEQLRHNHAARQITILNALPAHIALLDSEGRIVSVNQAWQRFADANALQCAEYGIGANYLDACDSAQGDDAATAQQAAAGIRALQNGAVNHFSMEYPCHSPTRQRWFLMMASPLADGLPDGVVVMHLDITDRMRAEQELRESERRFSDLLGNVELVSMMLDREARITYCNDFLLHLTGWQREEVIGCNWFDVFMPPELDDLKGSFFSALLSNLPDTWHHENEILTRSGERRLIRWNNSVLRSGDGEVIGAAGIGEDITEQKRTQQALAKLQRQRESILESLEEGIYGMDLEGRITFQNPAAAKMLGYRSEELIGRTAHTTMHYARRDGTPFPIAQSPIHTTLADGVVRRVEDEVFWRKDGASVQVEYTTAPKRNEQGAIVGGVVAFRDVTERKQREQEILATKNQLQATLDAIPDLLFEVGLDGRYYTCHSPRVDLLAAPPEELLSKTVAEVLPVDAADIVLAALREADATGHSTGKQFELALPQGRAWFELSVSRMAVASGQEARFICLSRDITERKRAEQELRESERVSTESRADAAAVRDIAARLQAILDTVVDGVVTIDEFGKVETFNPAAERIFGYAANEVVGRNVRMLMPEPYHGEHDGYLARYRVTGEARIIGTGREVMGLRKDGGTFPLDLSISEMTLGGERHYTGVVRDITEGKAAEREVVAARIEAERANAAKNTFLANMSHEIRTPMNGVIGMIEVLQQSSLSGPQMEMANIIRDSSFALLDVINDILDFSKIEAGKLEIDNVPMSVADVVEKACGILDRMALKKKVELTLFTDPTIPAELMGDPGRLRQILINLTNNAIKFSGATPRPGRVSVRALLVESDAKGVRLEFQVADNGIGLGEKSLARIFSPFVQADISTTREYGGTGLGLAISRQLADMMSGEIRVNSKPGVGSLFSVSLPLELPSGQTDAGRQPGLLAGLSCLVFGSADGMAGDLAAYLAHDEAEVERTADLATSRQWIASRSPGRAIIVIDTRVASPPLDELRATARDHPESDIHFVVIRRGLRRGLREEGSHLVSVDGNILTRRTLLDAVAFAAGLAQAPGQEVPDVANAPLAFLSGETVRRRGSRILVAEDNEINRSVILHQLALLGYVADLADDGREALTRWRQGHHALLLTDLHMPEMDGYELTATIRRAERNGQHLPIVALTANALKSEEVRCKAAGMDDYLTKPVLLDQLQAMLEKWLPIPGSDETAGDSPALPADLHLAALDRSVLPRQIGDDPALIARFFEDYRRSAQETADEIRAAVIMGDWKTAGDGGHKLKSSSRAVGALALGEVCARLEQAGTDGDADAMLALALEFEHALAAALGAMTQEGAAPANVLLVDDDAFQLQLLARQLAILGLDRVAACASGREALNRLDAQSVGEPLIFLDLSMPGMDGVEFIRQLVERQYTGALVLVSGEGERILETAERLARAHHLKVLGHLNKPVQFERLQALLNSWHSTAPKAAGKAAKRYGAEEVRRAIGGGELVNHYQPKVDVVSGALTGVEALVRWQHPDDGLVFPDDFIGVAEESGLIDDLTRVVLAEALGQTRRWLDQGLKLRVAVNVSMHNLARMEFADHVLGEVLRSGVAAEDLILEVTESRLMTDVLAPLYILTRLRLKHVGLSIDDFGTGHSSLSQLRDIPFDELKIDRSFVHGAAQDKTRGAIFTASLVMARQLGMKTVAEGVEDRADWNFLRQQGCDLAQGYFIARPMPAAKLPAWLADWETRRAKLVQP
ncbi:PAS domain S-box protein [Aromatoleum diolicum]|uniref:histidine kinase n=1 Tax=Aromatoleum diolicum TaxID=75796 RepID=A0ABX1QEV9_9RHOO|nr:PAS domain S-box protein [Aromatoleum diolicum]NMG76929.1 PAS domain S-box protein [Aromatoleum diolicum]